MEEKYVALLTETSERSKSNTHQIEEMKSEMKDMKEDISAINDLATSMKLMAQETSYMRQDITAVKESQADMTQKILAVENESKTRKADWYDTVVKLIVTGVVGAVVGAVCGVIFG